MSSYRFEIVERLVAELVASPEKTLRGQMSGNPFSLRIGIANYPQRIQEHYCDLVDAPIGVFGVRMLHPIRYRHFGLVCEFDTPTELHLYDGDVLCSNLHRLTDRFGPVVIRNAHLAMAIRAEGQRGRFQDLNFHIDRSFNQHTQYSLYTRDPDCSEQAKPRTASTLFVPNLVSILQDARENGKTPEPVEHLPSHHHLFADCDFEELIGKIIFEQGWSAPEGTGEIAVQHNPDIRHASWYRGLFKKGWPIGVRFLS